MSKRKNPLWKIILTDIGGVACLMLVPFLGPIPGPGGIPLIIAGFGLLALNHDWADEAVHYVRKHSERLRDIVFPDITWVKWTWDIVAVIILVFGAWLNFQETHWLIHGLSIGIMAGATTLFMMNRNRIEFFDRLLKRYGKK